MTDRGWAPRARQVGITGRSIAPRLYVAVGLSGKFNHMVGVRAAGTILAVNEDRAAPVFEHCDVGIVGDWHEVVPLLHAALRRDARRRDDQLRPAPAAVRTVATTSSLEAPGPSTAATPSAIEHIHVGRGTMPPMTTGVSRPASTQRAHDGRGQREVGAVVHGHADDVDVLLRRHGGDGLGRLAQAGVDDLAPGVAQDAAPRRADRGRARRDRPSP